MTAMHDEHARALVEQLIQAGGWPEPALLEAILAEGEAAVAPLLGIIQAEIAGETGDAIYHAAPLLGTIRALETLTPLVTLLQRAGREDDFDVVETLLDALPLFGPPGVGPLLDLVRDRDQAHYARSVAMDIAAAAAGNDPESRARVAAVLRALLADYVAESASVPGATPDTTYMVSSLVSSLAALADVPARPLIDAAFAAGLVDPMMIRPEHVDTLYAEGGTPVRGAAADPSHPRAWLEQYERDYAAHQEAVEQRRVAGEAGKAGTLLHESPFVRPQPVSVPPRPGRNDPCWCGSGKKYKKCHLPTDTRTGKRT